MHWCTVLQKYSFTCKVFLVCNICWGSRTSHMYSALTFTDSSKNTESSNSSFWHGVQQTNSWMLCSLSWYLLVHAASEFSRLNCGSLPSLNHMKSTTVHLSLTGLCHFEWYIVLINSVSYYFFDCLCTKRCPVNLITVNCLAVSNHDSFHKISRFIHNSLQFNAVCIAGNQFSHFHR